MLQNLKQGPRLDLRKVSMIVNFILRIFYYAGKAKNQPQFGSFVRDALLARCSFGEMHLAGFSFGEMLLVGCPFGKMLWPFQQNLYGVVWDLTVSH